MCCNTLQHALPDKLIEVIHDEVQKMAANTLQQTATHCSTIYHMR